MGFDFEDALDFGSEAVSEGQGVVSGGVNQVMSAGGAVLSKVEEKLDGIMKFLPLIVIGMGVVVMLKR
jgi:hypothetical protein